MNILLFYPLGILMGTISEEKIVVGFVFFKYAD